MDFGWRKCLSRRVLGLTVLCLAGSLRAASSIPDKIDFNRDVRPIFSDTCFACHGPEKRKSGLRLDGVSFLHQGGDRGPAITPGAAARTATHSQSTC